MHKCIAWGFKFVKTKSYSWRDSVIWLFLCHALLLDFQRLYLSLSGVHVVSQFEAGQDLHGVQADVDPVGWRQEPCGEETA